MTIDTRRNRVVVRLANMVLRLASSEYRTALRGHISASMNSKLPWDLLPPDLPGRHLLGSGLAELARMNPDLVKSDGSAPPVVCTCGHWAVPPLCPVHAGTAPVASYWHHENGKFYAEICVEPVESQRLVAHCENTSREQIAADLRALATAANGLAREIEPTYRPHPHFDLPGWDG